MKKFIWLIVATFTLSLTIWLAGNALREEPVPVHVMVLESRQVEQTVSCSGKVEQAGGEVLAVAAAGVKIQVRVAVPESRLRRVAVGQRVTVSGAAFYADSYPGTVVSLASTAYTTSSGSTVVDAVISLDAADESLRCGLTAKADICVARTEGILLPYSCLLADAEGREYVYLLRDGRAVKSDVTILEEMAEGVIVTAGVTEGDRLITNPEEVTKEGCRVQEVTP